MTRKAAGRREEIHQSPPRAHLQVLKAALHGPQPIRRGFARPIRLTRRPMNSDHQIFDRALYASRLQRRKTQPAHTLAQTMAEELAERLSLITRRFDRALLIAPWPATIAEAIKRSAKVKHL